MQHSIFEKLTVAQKVEKLYFDYKTQRFKWQLLNALSHVAEVRTQYLELGVHLEGRGLGRR
jgi:hypothetical protein